MGGRWRLVQMCCAERRKQHTWVLDALLSLHETVGAAKDPLRRGAFAAVVLRADGGAQRVRARAGREARRGQLRVLAGDEDLARLIARAAAEAKARGRAPPASSLVAEHRARSDASHRAVKKLLLRVRQAAHGRAREL